ncbi:hypothetical protein [Ornithinimicrobium kibberense]
MRSGWGCTGRAPPVGWVGTSSPCHSPPTPQRSYRGRGGCGR